MPPATPESLIAVNSTFRTASTPVQIHIAFATASTSSSTTTNSATKAAAATAPPKIGFDQQRAPIGIGPQLDCAGLRAASGPAAADILKLQKFTQATAAPPLSTTLAHSMSTLALQYVAAFDTRCAGLNNGTLAQLRSPNATQVRSASLLLCVDRYCWPAWQR